jgi:hypothetical protein
LNILLKERDREREERKKEREEQKRENEQTRQLLLQLLSKNSAHSSQNAEGNVPILSSAQSAAKSKVQRQKNLNKRTLKSKKTKGLLIKKSKRNKKNPDDPDDPDNPDDPDYVVETEEAESDEISENEEFSDEDFQSCKGTPSKNSTAESSSEISVASLIGTRKQDPEITLTGTEVYVQEIKLDLLSEPFDEFYFNFINTWDEAVMEYTRLNMCLGFTNTPRSNSISYESFARGTYYIVGKFQRAILNFTPRGELAAHR